MNPSTIEILASVLFGIAVLHTFCVKRFAHLAGLAGEPEDGDLSRMVGLKFAPNDSNQTL